MAKLFVFFMASFAMAPFLQQASAATHKKTTGKAATRTAAKGASHKSRPAAHPSTARRSGQLAPTADRYKDIQQALADKGYFQGTVDGTWGPGSVDALKRFQKDQNLTETGKLDSLSLIALGLGPKRNLSARSTSESRPKDDNRRPEGSERP